jgi:hypothetical protein
VGRKSARRVGVAETSTVRLGIHLRELWRLRLGVAASALLALLAAVWSVADISLLPLRVEPRSLKMGSAFTQVVVDTPDSTMFDLRQGTEDILPLKNRALLLGTVTASPPVRRYIARRAGIPAESLQIVPPRTPDQPRAQTAAGTKKGPGDLVKSLEQYRLDIQANPTVPLLNVYAQAPTAKASEELANAAVVGLGDYLKALARSEQTPDETQVRLRQLGAAHGDRVNHGIEVQVVAVAFSLVFAFSCAASVAIARVRRGWQHAVASGI